MLSEDYNTSKSSDNRGKPKINRICKYFTSNSGCKFGDNCRFQHEVLNQVSDIPSVSENNLVSSCKLEDEEVKSSQSSAIPNPEFSESENPISVKLVEENPNTNSHQNKRETTAAVKVCHHYSKLGWCRFGKRCRFTHPKKERGRGQHQAPVDNPEASSHINLKGISDANAQRIQNEECNQKVKPKQKPVCKFYLKGKCTYGTSCKFDHGDLLLQSPEQLSNERDVEPKQQTPPQPNIQQFQFNKVSQATKSKRRSDLIQNELTSLRNTECDQLKKRFPSGRITVLHESDKDSSYDIDFMPTDPDWPFDIRTFKLRIGVPEDYPLKLFTVTVREDELLPYSVARYIERQVSEWLEEKQAQLIEMDTVELVFRPFLRWFDRTLENIVTEGLRRYQRELTAKAAGFEFIPASGPPQGQIEDDPSLFVHTKPDDDNESESGNEEEGDSETTTDDDENEVSEKASPDYTEVERKGTEILLRHLQLKDSAATLVFHKLSIGLQCGRCKTTSQITTPAKRLNSITCVKCNNDQRLIYRPAMAHHFSSVIGYLDIADCQPYDLILQDCVGVMSCLNCSKEMKLEGLTPGQLKQSWCQRCHQKLTVATESVRFQQLQPSNIAENNAVHRVAVSKIRRLPKDPAIQEGKPLPDEGTCKHYKKSFRWLRFPCCGKCYPCDICHDDKEGDHEMKFASRMICGFCCKEQPYTVEKLCISCGSHMTKVRSSHWEGGKGCRDKVKMSRNDIHKYANMGKTISKKAQEKAETKKDGKKNTKLRHA